MSSIPPPPDRRRVPVPKIPAPSYPHTFGFLRRNLCGIARAVQSGDMTEGQAKARRGSLYTSARITDEQAANLERYYHGLLARTLDPPDTTRRALAVAVTFDMIGEPFDGFPAWVKSATHRQLFCAALILGAFGQSFLMPSNRTAADLAELSGGRTQAKCVRDFWRRGRRHGLLTFRDPTHTGHYTPPIVFRLGEDWRMFLADHACGTLRGLASQDPVLRDRIMQTFDTVCNHPL